MKWKKLNVAIKWTIISGCIMLAILAICFSVQMVQMSGWEVLYSTWARKAVITVIAYAFAFVCLQIVRFPSPFIKSSFASFKTEGLQAGLRSWIPSFPVIRNTVLSLIMGMLANASLDYNFWLTVWIFMIGLVVLMTLEWLKRSESKKLYEEQMKWLYKTKKQGDYLE